MPRIVTVYRVGDRVRIKQGVVIDGMDHSGIVGTVDEHDVEERELVLRFEPGDLPQWIIDECERRSLGSDELYCSEDDVEPVTPVEPE